MDGVWLPAGEESPRARGFPDGRHTPRPGIAKGEAFSPLVRPRQQQVGKSPKPTRAEPAKPEPNQAGTGQAGIGQPGAGQSAVWPTDPNRPGPITCKATLQIPRFTAPARSRIVNAIIKMLWET